jgi:hypothetical protein
MDADEKKNLERETDANSFRFVASIVSFELRQQPFG